MGGPQGFVRADVDEEELHFLQSVRGKRIRAESEREERRQTRCAEEEFCQKVESTVATSRIFVSPFSFSLLTVRFYNLGKLFSL
jgi:hypothetical protein